MHPNDPKAVANRILALLLLDRNDEAFQAGRAALAADPSNELAAFYLIQAAARLPDETDPLNGIPPALANRADILFAQAVFCRLRGDDTWIAKAQQARTRFPDNKRIVAYAAEADIAEAAQRAASVTTYKLPDGLRSRIEQAAQFLTDAWDRVLSTEQKPGPEQLAPAASAMIAWKLSGHPSKAASIAAQLVKHQANDRHALFNAAQILHEDDRDDLVDEALALAPDTPDFAFIRAMRLIEQGKWDDAVSIFKATEIPEVERDLVDAFIAMAPFRDTSKAVDVDCLRKAMPAPTSDPRALIVFARTARQRGLTELADEAFAAARKAITPASNMAQRLMAATYAADTNDPAAVIELLHDYIPLDEPTIELRWLATAHAAQNPKRPANLEFFKKLPPAILSRPAFSQAYAGVLIDTGSPADAIPILKSVRDARPRDPYAALQLAQAYARLKDQVGQKALAQSIDISTLDGRPQHLMAMAQFLCRQGRTQEALALGYRVLRAAPDDPRVVLGYCGIFFLEPRKRIVTTPPAVERDTAVILKDQDGTVSSFMVDDQPGFWGVEARSPDADDVKPLLGKPKGFTFSPPRRFPTSETREIVEIKSKYLHAFHVILGEFETRFPAHGGLWGVQTKGTDIAPILDAVRELAESDLDQVRLYTEQGWPLSFAARMVGRDVFAFASYLRQLGHDILTCDGNAPERAAAIELAKQHRGKGATLDAYTAAVAAQFGVLPALKEWFGTLYLPSSSIALLDRLLDDERAKLGTGYMSIAWIDGRFVRYVPTEDEIKNQIALLESIRAALLEHATVEEVLLPDDAPEPVAAVAEKFGGAVFEAIFLARNHGTLLLSDDLRLRRFAADIAGKGIWMQPVLLAAAEAGLIDGPAYLKGLVGLAGHRHSHTCLTTADLLAAFRGVAGATFSDFGLLAARLGGKHADAKSHADVAIGFLLALWADDAPKHPDRNKATGLILQCLTRQRHDDWPQILGYVAAAVRHHNDLLEYISDWLRGHFLPVEPVAKAYEKYARIFDRQVALARIRAEPGVSMTALALALRSRSPQE